MGGVNGRPYRMTLAGMVAILVGAFVLSLLMGERIPLHEGFGFEAHSIYLPLTVDLWERLAERDIDAYSIQRLLPFIAANLTLRALGQPLDGGHILLFFEIWNVVVLATAVWLWLRLAAQLSVSRPGQWLGFVCLFGSFAVLKLVPYYPVNIDSTALLLGLATLLLWVERSTWRLLVVSLAGLIVWPTNLLVAALLLLLPPGTRLPSRVGPLPLGPAIAAVGTLALWLAFGWSYFVAGVETPAGLAEPIRLLLPLAFLAVAAWVGIGLIELLRGNERPVDAVPWPGTERLVALLVLIAAWFFLTRGVASPSAPRLSAGDFVMHYLTPGATSRPAQFLVAHVTYLGPIVLLALLTWRRTCRQMRSLGGGLVAVAAFGVVFGVNSESRQLTNIVPFLALPVVLAVDRAGLSARVLPVAAVVALAFSKLWLPINYAVESLGEAGRSFPLGAGDFQSFPAQAWFLNFGPWISNEMLAVQGIAGAMAAWWLRHSLESSPE